MVTLYITGLSQPVKETEGSKFLQGGTVIKVAFKLSTAKQLFFFVLLRLL